MSALEPESGNEVERMVRRLAEQAKAAQVVLALASTETKNKALTEAAAAIRRR